MPPLSFRALRWVLALLVLAALGDVVACDDHAVSEAVDPVDTETAPDVAAPDSVAPPTDTIDTGTPPSDTIDTGPPTSCSGESWVRTGDVTRPVPVTSANVIMDCCDGFSLRFHVGERHVDDLHVMFRWGGASLPAGKWDLAELADQAEARDCRPGEPCPAIDLRGAIGWLSVSFAAPDLRTVELCVEEAVRDDGTSMAFYSGAVPLSGYSAGQLFELYLLEDETLTALDVEGLALDSLTLAPSPALGYDAVAAYHGSDHVIETTWWSLIPAGIPEPSVFGRPFVLVVSGERIYLGAFMTPISSWAPSVPFIDLLEATSEVIPIRAPMAGDDPRADPRLEHFLRGVGRWVP